MYLTCIFKIKFHSVNSLNNLPRALVTKILTKLSGASIVFKNPWLIAHVLTILSFVC